MNRSIFSLTLLAITLFLGCSDKEESKVSTKEVSEEEKAITQTISDMYGNLGIDTNKQPDFNRVKNQFTSDAEMGSLRGDSLVLKSPNEYFSQMETGLQSANLTYLEEWEMESKTYQFGPIAQRTNVYGVKVNSKDSIVEIGVTSFQLVKLNGKWKIKSMIWQAETDKYKLSDDFLN